jgi:signal transduction histidine kinase
MAATAVSIKAKLRSMIVLSSAAALLLTSLSFVAYEVFSFKSSLVRNTGTMAQIIADNSAAAVAFQRDDEATTILAALHAEPDILEAVIYDQHNKPYAHYQRPNVTPALPAMIAARSGYRFENGSLIYFQPVTHGGDVMGTLVLRSSLQALYRRLGLYLGIVLGVMAGALVIAYWISGSLQRGVANPILALAETAKTVSTRNDYTLRAQKLSSDEVGQLTESFNAMLQTIQENREQLRSAHAQIQQHANHLEKMVAERTAKLQDTIGELEAFSYSVSHDMRAPLRAMSRYAEVLLADAGKKLDGCEQQYLERIVASSKRLDALIQDALTYSRVCQVDLDLKQTDVAPLITGIIEQYPALHPDKADIVCETPFLKVLAHDASLTQCLSNLLANAVKFVEPGTRPNVVIRTEPRGNDVRICVCDNGIGIAAQDQQRIFGMFARIHSDKLYEGTGIGLAIVRKAAERMGGSCGVESELGKGSTFWIQLKSTYAA